MNVFRRPSHWVSLRWIERNPGIADFRFDVDMLRHVPFRADDDEADRMTIDRGEERGEQYGLVIAIAATYLDESARIGERFHFGRILHVANLIAHESKNSFDFAPPVFWPNVRDEPARVFDYERVSTVTPHNARHQVDGFADALNAVRNIKLMVTDAVRYRSINLRKGTAKSMKNAPSWHGA